MTCAICNGTGMMRVVRSGPNDTEGRVARRFCICGALPKPQQGVSGNTPLEGRELTPPDLSRYRLKAGRFRMKIKRHKDYDYSDDAAAETIDFKALHGIR